jgi:hypothetical protein
MKTSKAFASMSATRKTALIAGIIYLITFVSIQTLSLYVPVRAMDYISGPAPVTPVIIGCILEIIVALGGIGTAVVLYPVLHEPLKQQLFLWELHSYSHLLR